MTLDNACPKPERSPRKPRRGLPPSSSRPPRKRKRTAAQEAAKFAREYGGKARHDWVETLPCCACGVVGYSENAHVGNKGAGQGRKADYDQIAPLCGPRPGPCGSTYEGCHRESHRGQQSFELEMNVNLAECAAETERAFVAFSGGAENEEETA